MKLSVSNELPVRPPAAAQPVPEKPAVPPGYSDSSGSLDCLTCEEIIHQPFDEFCRYLVDEMLDSALTGDLVDPLFFLEQRLLRKDLTEYEFKNLLRLHSHVTYMEAVYEQFSELYAQFEEMLEDFQDKVARMINPQLYKQTMMSPEEAVAVLNNFAAQLRNQKEA